MTFFIGKVQNGVLECPDVNLNFRLLYQSVFTSRLVFQAKVVTIRRSLASYAAGGGFVVGAGGGGGWVVGAAVVGGGGGAVVGGLVVGG